MQRFTGRKIDELRSAVRAAGFAMVPSEETGAPPPRLMIERQPPQDLATAAWRSPRVISAPEAQRPDPMNWRNWFASLDWRAPA